MFSTSQFLLAVVCGWSSLIDIAHSANSDPSVFFPDDFTLSTTDISNTGGGLSSDLFSGSDSLFDQAALDFNFGMDTTSAALDTQWLGFDDSDPSSLEASCAGGRGPQTVGKVRRADGQICSDDPRKNNPDFSNLQFPTFMQIEQSLEDSRTKPDAKAGTASKDDNNECPKPYDKHVCCTGPGIQSFPESGIHDAVQGCEPWFGPCPIGTHDFCCKVISNLVTTNELQRQTGYLYNVGQACVLFLNIDIIGIMAFK